MIQEETTLGFLQKNYTNAKKIQSVLKEININSLTQDEIEFLLSHLLTHKVRDVKIYTIKILSRLKSDNIISKLIKHYSTESDSLSKREIISAVGRMRSLDYLYFLKEILNESDPKLVLQAIRALLIFKNNSDIYKILEQLKNHPNEMIQDVLKKELVKDNSVSKKRKDHSEVNQKLKNIVVNGDVIESLKCINEESLHLTFTSPPYYNARDYSFYTSYEEYLNFLRKVFKEIHRITKNGRYLIVNTSPIIVPRVSRAHSSKRYPIPFDINSFLTEDGWEFIDDIIWQKPDYSVKNRIGGFMQHRKPLTYKPNCVTEYVMVYRKKTKDLIDWNLKQYDEEIILNSKVDDDYEVNNVWKIDPVNDKVHSAIFPKGLCQRIIKYYSFKNDLIFDPFGGSGTLGEVALEMGRNMFMTEIDPDYFNRIKQRLFLYDDINYLTLNEFKKWMKKED